MDLCPSFHRQSSLTVATYALTIAMLCVAQQGDAADGLQRCWDQANSIMVRCVLSLRKRGSMLSGDLIFELSWRSAQRWCRKHSRLCTIQWMLFLQGNFHVAVRNEGKITPVQLAKGALAQSMALVASDLTSLESKAAHVNSDHPT